MNAPSVQSSSQYNVGQELTLRLFSLFVLLGVACLAGAQSKAQPSNFAALADRYFDEYYFKFNPSNATAAGFHQYDDQLEDYSRASIDKQIALLKKFKGEFSGRSLPAKPTDAELAEWTDLTLILDDINGRLLSLENIRAWEKNPDQYSGGITNSIFIIMARTFAPLEQRLKSVVAREKQVPAAFQAARQNVKNPPPIYVEVALEQIPGLISFFQKDVPDAFKDVKDQALLAEFNAVNQKV